MRRTYGFPGLTGQSYYPGIGGSADYRDDIADEEDAAGYHPCNDRDNNIPPNPIIVQCRDITGINIVDDVDLLDARRPDTNARLGDLSPAPDFVQVYAATVCDVEPGTVGCRFVGGVPAGCGPLENAMTVDLIMHTATADYPYGETETITLPGGSTFTHTYKDESVSTLIGDGDSALLHRPIDGLSYEGDPGNDGVDTLIPFSEIVADPTLSLGYNAGTVWRSVVRDRVYAVYPFWRITEATPSDRVWIIGSV